MIRSGSVLLAVLLAAGAVDAYATTGGTLPPPVSGAWKIFLGDSGHFTVTPHHRGVRGLTITFGSGAPAGCEGTVSVVGTHLIHHVSGTTRTPAGTMHTNSWIVGRKGSGFAEPETATIEAGGQRITGGLALSFTPRGGPFPKSLGRIRFQAPGQPRCDATFYFKKS